MAKNERANIPEKQRYFLWAKSAGRCQICNDLVYQDWLTFSELNIADVAHIIGSSSDGPRGDEVKSKELGVDPENLMLLCKTHHKLIDEPDFIKDYPPEKLREIKRSHEERIERLTGITELGKTHVLLYSANIGKQGNPVSYNFAKLALVANEQYPAESRPITIGISGSYASDERNEFWINERANLKHAYETQVGDRIKRGEIESLSVFALAPIPLLIELGSLLSDKTPTNVYQLLREPAGWIWQKEDIGTFDYLISQPIDMLKKTPALVLSFSGTIAEQDVHDTLGNDVAIWQMTIPTIGNDFLRDKTQLALFRTRFRALLDRIKQVHGRHAQIHLFPAIPVSIAVELGRVWMPKADLSIIIYDRNHTDRRFSPTFAIL